MTFRVQLEAGQVYYNESQTKFRRIIGVVQQDGRHAVVYNDGGDHNRNCTRETFLAWRDKPKRNQKDAQSSKD